ncbi:MAG: DUF5684 domain-containing protein [Bacteroidales bacterium]|nr:DUF5684 domain-containing protein [Bacteroidales bacterium]
MTFLYILSVVVFLLILISMWNIYTKAGKPGWAVIVPVYNILILLEIAGKPWWWLFLLILPVANIFYGIWLWNLVSLSFGKDEGFTVGLILLPFVFIPILGLGDDLYKGPAGASKNRIKRG